MAMAWNDRRSAKERMRAIAPVVAIHALLGYAFVTGLDFEIVRDEASRLKLFSVAPELPPPPVAVRPEPAADRPEGAAAPPSRPPTAIVAPPPQIPIERPPPVTAAPVPGSGANRTTGTSDVAGLGSGAGGEGTGTGSGGAGSGTGGGLGRPAEQISGALMHSDYPRDAKRKGEQGSVFVRYIVGTDGRVRDCQILFSTASSRLNEVTCAVIEKRFRFRPALDEAGRPTEWTIRRDFDWFFVRTR